MGLDIVAYRELVAVPNAPMKDGQPVHDDAHFLLAERLVHYTEAEFPGRTAGLVPPGIYAWADRMRFRAGSYGGYNDWRNDLARLAGYPAADKCDHRLVFAESAWRASSGPFWELINFSDCEGVIGPLVAAKLAADFREHEAKIAAAAGEPYASFAAAFAMAADGGLVRFC